MLPNLIKRKMSVDEIRVLIKMVLEERGQIFIRKHKNINSPKSPFFTFNIEVYTCVSHTIPNNIQFQIQGGYMNMEFDNCKESGYDIELELNKAKDGYWLNLDGMSILYKIEKSKFKNILNNLKTSVDKDNQEEVEWQKQYSEDNAYLPENFWKELYQ